MKKDRRGDNKKKKQRGYWVTYRNCIKCDKMSAKRITRSTYECQICGEKVFTDWRGKDTSKINKREVK